MRPVHGGVSQVLQIVKRQRIEAFIHRGVQSGFYSADSNTATELVSDSDDSLFRNVMNNENHVLYKLLPERTAHDYNLRQRRHDLTLHVNPGCFLKIFISIIIYDTYFIILCTLFYYLLDFLNCISYSTVFHRDPITYTLFILA